MENEFVDYQSALYLKELGFDELCFGAFYADVESNKTDKYDVRKKFTAELDVSPFNDEIIGLFKNSDKDYYVARPTYSQVFRWFREKHKLFAWIERLSDNFIYEIKPHKLSDYKDDENYVFDTYEETELECLRKLIEIVKKS
jgi:hypothetical protein